MKHAPDKALVKDQLQAVQTMLSAYGPAVFVSAMFWILVKREDNALSEDSGRILPFRLNDIQLHLLANLACNNLLLKARQIGGTTFFTLVRGLLPVVTHEGTNAVLISQSNEYAQFHFEIPHRAVKYFGAVDPYDMRQNDLNISLQENLLHTKFKNKRELYFDQLESTFRVASAEVEEAAQGVTLHHIIASEYSRWPGKPAATLANVRGALVPGGTVDKECTANGAGGPFYEDYIRAMDDPENSDAKAHFYPWFWAKEYTKDDLTPEQAKDLQADLQNDERILVEKFQLDLKQIAWRRETKKAFPGVEFEEKYPEDWKTAFIVSGKSYFDRDILVARDRELIGYTPLQTFGNGESKFFVPRIPGRRYVIGADPATGRDASGNGNLDYAAAVVLDLETGEECAAYRARVTPEELAYDLADIGRYYNTALIAVERTGDGGACILVLAGDCRYTSIYLHREWHKRERKIVAFEGFPTTTKTRPVALNMVNRWVKDSPEMIHDTQFITEALNFVRDEKGKPAAAVGCHDDTVSARWIAHAARQATLGYWQPWLPSTREGYVTADRMAPVGV